MSSSLSLDIKMSCLARRLYKMRCSNSDNPRTVSSQPANPHNKSPVTDGHTSVPALSLGAQALGARLLGSGSSTRGDGIVRWCGSRSTGRDGAVRAASVASACAIEAGGRTARLARSGGSGCRCGTTTDASCETSTGGS